MMSYDIDKYESSIINNINKDNLNKIVSFLISKGCNYIEELLEDYLDIFTFEYSEFLNKYEKLNKKYNGRLIEEIRDDMNILEEFYVI